MGQKEILPKEMTLKLEVGWVGGWIFRVMLKPDARESTRMIAGSLLTIVVL